MVTGLSIDIIEVERIESRIKNDNGFMELVFSAHENTYCEAQKHKFEHYARVLQLKKHFLKPWAQVGQPVLRLMK